MESINYYRKQAFWGIVIMIILMILQLFVVNCVVDGKFPAVWIGALIGTLIRYKIKNIDMIEIYLGLALCLAMILNYILFIYCFIYIPNQMILFIGLAAILVYYLMRDNSKYKYYKIGLLLILLIGFFSADYYLYTSNIIKDRNFCRYIKKEYGIKGRIKEEDLKGIEELFIDDDYHVNNIKGIEYFKDVKSLWIWDGKMIKDFRPIAALSKLEHLNIWYINVDKLEKVPRMESLKWLEIVYPKGGKLDNLENFPNLEQFEVQGMDFDNLTGLKGPSQLKRLDIGDGQLTKFDGIESFSNLKELDLYKMNIRDVSRVFDLENLKSINLEGGHIYNKDYFNKMTKEKDIVVKERE